MTINAYLGAGQQLHKPRSGTEGANLLLATFALQFRSVDSFDPNVLAADDDGVAVDDNDIGLGTGDRRLRSSFVRPRC